MKNVILFTVLVVVLAATTELIWWAFTTHPYVSSAIMFFVVLNYGITIKKGES